jgi:thioredoxin-related protein
MKHSRILFALLLLTLPFSACQKELVTKIELPEGYFENQWQETLTAAKEFDRHMFIHFYADWCNLCADFKKDVLNDAEVEAYMKSKFIGALMDSEKGIGKELYSDFQLEGHPNMVVTDKNGNLIASQRGKLSKTEFLDWIKAYE